MCLERVAGKEEGTPSLTSAWGRGISSMDGVGGRKDPVANLSLAHTDTAREEITVRGSRVPAWALKAEVRMGR